MAGHQWLATALVTLLLATAAQAGPKDNDQGNGNGKGKGNGHAADFHCPPGLAKKNPFCLPPGQLGKLFVVAPSLPAVRAAQPPVIVTPVAAAPVLSPAMQVYPVGAVLPDDYVIMLDPLFVRDWQSSQLVRSGDHLYIIDPLTGAVRSVAAPVADWAWNWSDVDFANCPPGLAKKNPPCVPPGQVQRGAIIGQGPLSAGQVLPAGYQTILDPHSYAALDDALYVRLGDQLYRLDRQTGVVLNLIGTVAQLLQ